MLLYLALIIGLIVIVFLTKLTQTFKLSNLWFFIGQICASLIIIIIGELEISHIGQIDLGYLTIPLSLFFLLGFTNVMNMGNEQKPIILLLPFISLICLTIIAFIMGYSFLSISGLCMILTVMFILLYSYFSKKMYIGRTTAISIGFIIAVLSLSLLKISFKFIFIPIFTLAFPFAMYNLIQNKYPRFKSIIFSSLTSIMFSVLPFVAPTNVLWYFVVGLTAVLIVMQMSSKHRFIQ